MTGEKAAFPRNLIRPDLADFAGYSSARTSAPADSAGGPEAGHTIWLNANESGQPSPADPAGTSRRYPDPQPAALVAALAENYGVEPERVVVGRGSDEAIELVLRAVCAPGADAIAIAPPTFGMYQVSARLHGVRVHEVPQTEVGQDQRPAADSYDEYNGYGDWRVDTDAVAATAERTGARIVFLATPGNPTGATIGHRAIADLAARLAPHTLLVIDEAYQEFAAVDGHPSAVHLLDQHPNLVVLRTLSKAHALAAARVGVAIAHPDLATVLRRVQAPYPIPTPVLGIALRALEPEATRIAAERIAATVALRARLDSFLSGHPWIDRVHPSAANFLLVRASGPAEASALFQVLLEAGIVIRDFRATAGLDHTVRITIGDEPEIAALIEALTTAPTEPTPTATPSRAAASHPSAGTSTHRSTEES